jgi:integrin-linked kinase-associated serine/threonine phosphatase 2C
MYQSTTMQVGLIATPDVHSFELTKKDNFILLGCDGLWGVCPFILLCYINFFPHLDSFNHIYDEPNLHVSQVFGPSDAVEFVQKQLKVLSNLLL